jgi:hypothetical protein
MAVSVKVSVIMQEHLHEQQLLNEFRQLDSAGQQQVVEFARTLRTRPPGEPGWKIVEHALQIDWPSDDLEDMARATESLREQVDDFPEVSLNR